MDIQRKLEIEMCILKGLIARYKSIKDSESISMVIAYEYALQVLSEVYEVSKQEKK